MSILFSRGLFLFVLLFGFLSLLTPAAWAQTGGPPPKPSKPMVTGGNQQVTLTASVGDPDLGITGWEYQQNDGGGYGSWTQIDNSSGSSLSTTITGLTNGTAYRFKVRAIKQTDTGDSSDESDLVTPATTPGAPGKPTVTGGNRQVKLRASVSDNGGSPVTGWEYQQNDGGGYGSWTEIGNNSSGNSLSGTVTDLQNGTTYKFKVRAVNSVGDGAESPESYTVTPVAPPPTVPGAPGKPTVNGGNQEVTLRASVSDNGGSPVTGWEYQQNVGGGDYGSWTSISSSSSGNLLSGTVTGLQNGTAYRFKVRAVNSVGDGAESLESDAVTPTCPGYSPAVTAQDVETLRDPETLAAFVKEARTGIGMLLSNTVSEEEGIRNLVECFGADGDWKHGSVHLFMISADENKKFFLAPGDSELAGTLLDVEDENGCDVGEEILRAAGGEDLQCDDLGLAGDDPGPGFVQYLWRDLDDPDSEDYDSPRLSYVEEIRFESFLPSMSFVLGSGYYPEISVPEPEGETSGSGGGCALVAETGTRNDAGVGLFLGVLAIGCAVFLGRGVFPLRG